MDIKLGTIVDNSDMLERGVISVIIEDIDPANSINVLYTSPYLAGGSGGFVAIPEPGMSILVVQPSNSGSWYYMSTVVESDARLTDVGNDSFVGTGEWLPESHKAMSKQSYYQQILIKSPRGSALRLSDIGDEKTMNTKAELSSRRGKRLTLHDSPEVNAIILEDVEGNGLKILEDEGQVHIKAKRSIILVSRQSNIDIRVVDGGEINIQNNSTGAQRVSETDTTPGNINLRTLFGDISLIMDSRDGSLFIDCKGSNGNVHIKAGKQITLESDDTINLIAPTINIQGTNTTIIGEERLDLNV